MRHGRMSSTIQDCSDMVFHKVIEVNGIKTWISFAIADVQNKTRGNVVVLVVPGNPGPIGFYDAFISRLHEVARRRLTIYGISHAGHHLLPRSSENDEDLMKYFHSNEEVYTYSLDQQVAHKLAFIEEHLPVDVKLVLIGHSVGAYIVLEMIDRLHHKDRFLRGVLLFPTIERISRTRKGLLWTTLSTLLTWPLLTMGLLFEKMPCPIQQKLVDLVVRFRRFKDTRNISASILSFFNSRGIRNLLQVASDMRHIQDITFHESLIRKQLSKLTFYYGQDDPWVPLQFAHELRARFPQGDIKICTKGIAHAFVLHSGADMGEMVWDWIKASVVGFYSSGQSGDHFVNMSEF